ncbi:1,4-dihydroxy-2-naphthoate octaprenyltransferase [Anoxybacillus sp. B7M1]|jgi:1,4-dihydroxy-2-naphthoate polyprenyltransferase|uniref:1,4-dihydroxy-2-naphthoate octaprenyltransferase n=1 Tax=Anoxybacteroides rupiense TaxID=311460 RepID=A0ABD5ISU2_9BACL|nr:MULTISPECIES: 1,4-dihydroxy-2-naphthoate polyprenyltransferase [Anoxybacillus]ANB58739.1 1,4-dihydroxy-2-naphthoate octaprenyltransferase [Anoxybacillus sp. B2M1]ANB64193.1 1,4-dihydroxy-2-naphthoate octaprenyltransferase [Anoxybacillus sp. B7M1]KXG08789.1 1,4-dihydroxy-2-naphthoate octaprenyltransferase [Anoxybacillus sp. P3H1B]MBB3906951.1 1,4-dihydroxy-2-naphthoate octaprenyltransferase [Anoxybacillus rupiensis]MBS2771521.1 1,4-dihydroxy-2-naphthoate polyprenyltransferase [Anoxybacillus 
MQSPLPKHQPTPSLKYNRSWRVWWNLTRPHTLTAAFVPVSIGTALAFRETAVHLTLFLAMLIASLLIQAATNMFNEYYDYKRGLDSSESVGIGGAIVREGIAPKTVLLLAFSFIAISILIGVYICMNSSWWIAVVGTICVAAGYFYTGGPIPIAYTPFGELAAGFFMGLIIILISFFIQTGTITFVPIVVSIPIAILVGAILLANNIRDLDGDQQHGRKTLAILIGRTNAIRLLGGMFIVSFAWMIGLIALHVVSPWTLLVFLSVPKAVAATKGFIGKTKPIEMMPAMKATAQANTQFGFLLAIGLLIGHWL